MTAKEQFLTNQQRYQPLILPQRFSDEEMVRDWTLNRRDCQMVNKYRKQYRLGIAIQLCAMRLYGRFLNQLSDLSSRVVSYLSSQLDLPPTLTVEVPEREATLLEHRNNILKYLGFRRFDDKVEDDLDRWVEGNRAFKISLIFNNLVGWPFANYPTKAYKNLCYPHKTPTGVCMSIDVMIRLRS